MCVGLGNNTEEKDKWMVIHHVGQAMTAGSIADPPFPAPLWGEEEEYKCLCVCIKIYIYLETDE